MMKTLITTTSYSKAKQVEIQRTLNSMIWHNPIVNIVGIHFSSNSKFEKPFEFLVFSKVLNSSSKLKGGLFQYIVSICNLRGRLKIDGKFRSETLFDSIKKTQNYSNNNNIIAFTDNSRQLSTNMENITKAFSKKQFVTSFHNKIQIPQLKQIYCKWHCSTIRDIL